MRTFDSNITNSLIHLYRGEMGRMTAYRMRLDTTTNWSIVTTAGIATFSMSNPGVSHVVFLFAMFLNFFFLQLEARRLRAYELAHQRVRLMERFFYGEMLGFHASETWRQEIMANLVTPKSPMNHFNAMGWRLRRNYLWIYLAVLFLWLFKLHTLAGTNATFLQVVARANIIRVPGYITLSAVLIFYTGLLLTSVLAKRQYQLEMD